MPGRTERDYSEVLGVMRRLNPDLQINHRIPYDLQKTMLWSREHPEEWDLMCGTGPPLRDLTSRQFRRIAQSLCDSECIELFYLFYHRYFREDFLDPEHLPAQV